MPADFDIDDVDSDDYDTEAIAIDLRNNNFTTDRLEEYRHENIVRESLVNGQFSQAREQCARYGLNYELERHKFKTGETATA